MGILSSSILFLLATPVYARQANDPFAEQWAYEKIGLEDAWDITTGSSDVVVAIIDNGFDHFHPDLRNNVWINEDEIPRNGIDDDGNGYIDDVYGWDFVRKDRDGDGVISSEEALGDNDPRPDPNEHTLGDDTNSIHHGTIVAGIIGAEGNNGKDGTGIAWDVSLMNIRFVENDGVGSFAQLERAIRYAMNNGADVINISLVGPEWSTGLRDIVEQAAEQGVVIVAAAGNKQRQLDLDPVYPVCSDAGASSPSIIGVNAIQENRRLASFSNVGRTCVDLTAPGVDIASTVRFSPTNGFEDRYKGGWNGTSFAAPMVSGVVALLKSVQPYWGVAEIHKALTAHTSVTPGQDPDAYEILFGAGLVQADDALAYAVEQEQGTPPAVLFNHVLVATTDGVLRVFQDEPQQPSLVSELDGVDDVIAYEEDGNVRYVTATYNDAVGSITVQYYSETWSPIRSWSIDATGPASAEVADVTGSSQVDVVLSSPTEGTRVFTKHGRLVKTLTTAASRVALVPTTDGSYTVAVMAGGNGTYGISFFDRSLQEEDVVDVSFPGKTLPSIDIGIISGVRRIVLGAGIGDLPYLALYNFNGQLVTSFFAYDGAYIGGLDVAVVNNSILSNPHDVSYPVRVWTGSGGATEQQYQDPDHSGNRILLDMSGIL